jgi:hypothetical protein
MHHVVDTQDTPRSSDWAALTGLVTGAIVHVPLAAVPGGAAITNAPAARAKAETATNQE